MSLKRAIILMFSLGLGAGAAFADEALTWRGWGADLFAAKPADNRLVILDLEAVWCHWCHVMEETTYHDPKVVALLKSKFVTVRADQDANPDLSNRYGDWGWPATIIFDAKGQELIKRRGYLEPKDMTALLEAVIADPTPGPSVSQDAEATPADSAFLSKAQRADLSKRSNDAFDTKNAGWGDGLKFIDPDSMDHLLSLTAKGDAVAAKNARATFDAALNIIDPEWGGIYQYSDAVNWRSPHYEKIMSYQSNGLRQYSLGYELWKDPKHLTAARDIYRYLTTKLLSPDGAFFTSQDADVDTKMHGKEFYALKSAEREKLGKQPRIDTHIYARENGWAISALAAYYGASADAAALQAAEKAAHLMIEKRKRADGLFSHGDADRGGPYLGDTLAMGQAFLDLYAATGRREWLDAATQAGDVIAAKFQDPKGGFLTTLTAEAASGAFKQAFKPLDEQIQVTRFANLLHRYSGVASYRPLAEHGMKYLASKDLLDSGRPLTGTLLADAELANEPVHLTIVGAKDAPDAQALHATARAVAVSFKRVDWWDKREGALKNPDVTYPELDQPAAFLCTNRICSLPAFTPEELQAALKRVVKGTSSGAAAN